MDSDKKNKNLTDPDAGVMTIAQLFFFEKSG